MLLVLVFQIYWGMVFSQMCLRFEELQYPFLFLVPVFVLFLCDIPYMLSQAIPVWGLHQISKFLCAYACLCMCVCLRTSTQVNFPLFLSIRVISQFYPIFGPPTPFACGRHKWMTPILKTQLNRCFHYFYRTFISLQKQPTKVSFWKISVLGICTKFKSEFFFIFDEVCS